MLRSTLPFIQTQLISNEVTLVIITMDELLKWKPPKPSIDIDDVREIEKFLFGPSSIDHDLVSYHTCSRGSWECPNDRCKKTLLRQKWNFTRNFSS